MPVRIERDSRLIHFHFVPFFRYEMRRYRLALEAYYEAENIVKNSDWEIFYNIGT